MLTRREGAVWVMLGRHAQGGGVVFPGVQEVGLASGR